MTTDNWEIISSGGTNDCWQFPDCDVFTPDDIEKAVSLLLENKLVYIKGTIYDDVCLKYENDIFSMNVSDQSHNLMFYTDRKGFKTFRIITMISTALFETLDANGKLDKPSDDSESS